MSGSKNWILKRSELAKDPNTGRLHNSEKFRELGELIDSATDYAKNEFKELAIRLCRKALEEVGNIVQHNKTWNEVCVKTDLNTTKTKFKITIKYDGGSYYNPSGLKHIMDEGGLFEKYEREEPIVESDGTVIIKIHVNFKAGDENELI